MDEGSEQGDSKVRVAGIEARTAIAVALVGALTSLATVLVTSFFDNERMTRAEWEETAPKQHWLRIRGIDGPEDARLRLVAKVDGVSYAYPTETAWVVLGGPLTEGRFPLPLGSPPYRISFSAERGGPEGGLYLSQTIKSVDVSSDEQRYRLLSVAMDDGGWSNGSARGVSVGSFLEVRYSITAD